MSFGLLEEKRVNIIIVGSGKVGYTLAQHLNAEGHEITVIDSDEEKIKDLSSEMDIYCVLGNGTSYRTQKEAGIEKADLLISVANQDEVNLLSCLIAKKAGNCQTIARVRNPEYYDEIGYIREELGLSMSINPEWEAANEMARLIQYPSALAVEKFRGGMTLLRVVIPEKSVLNGMSVAEFAVKISRQILVCIVKRGKEIRIPDGNFVIEKGDRMHVVASHQNLKSFFRALGHKEEKVKKVMICGGGHVCFYLAVQLQQAGMQVKIIEQNQARCEELCELLPKATIIHGDATDQELLIEEGLENANAIVALTGMDEENIMMALFAKTRGIKKIVAKVNADTRAQMVESLGIESTVSAKSATADAILAYVKARMNSYSSANIETMYRLLNGKIVAQEYIINKECDFTNTPLKDLPTKPNNLIACIGRHRRIIIPNGDDHLEVGDSVIVIAKEHTINDFKDILA